MSHSMQAWTLEEAMNQLRLRPQDAYLEYVALQLARREGRLDEVVLSPWGETRAEPFSRVEGRRDSVDLFSLFTGALAVQESLQLDAMRPDNLLMTAGENGRSEIKNRTGEMVPVTSLPARRSKATRGSGCSPDASRRFRRSRIMCPKIFTSSSSARLPNCSTLLRRAICGAHTSLIKFIEKRVRIKRASG